ncbi:MAG: YdcF family protein [Clostridia bacterium]|nr:YdcF family protein [Clostridia bacterium]
MTLLNLLKRKAVAVTAGILFGVLLLGVCFVLGVNAYVVSSTRERVVEIEKAVTLEDVDCILVLGCLVKDDGTPSDMLADRLLTGVRAYESMSAEGNGTKLLMSGDHGREDYNEVYAMKQYAIAAGVESSEIFMDHAGFSTYESLYRAKEIFGADKIVIVTQEYHLHRALHIAESLGIEAYGIAADVRTYSGQTMRDLREILARNKDFLTSLFKPDPTYLGELISLEGDGDVTNDCE